MPTAQPRKYEGQTIFVKGPERSNFCHVFQHTDQYGVTYSAALMVNKAYRVGENDENGKTIEDWVYESYMDSDMNPNRRKTKADVAADKHDVALQGGLTCVLNIDK